MLLMYIVPIHLTLNSPLLIYIEFPESSLKFCSFLYIHVCVLVKINYSQWWYTVGWSPKEYQVRKSLLTNCHLEDETEAGQKCWVKTKSLCYMYSAVNKNTVQQCITKVMADVINHMYFYYFYNVSEGYSRTINLYKWHVSLHFYLTYHLVFPNPSLPPVMVVEGEGVRQLEHCLSCTSFCHLASLSALSLAICCCTASLWAHSLALSSLIWFTKNFVPVSPLGPFWLYQVLVPDDVHQILPSWFPKCKEFSLSSLHWWR